jgi:HPr kinase/phosphorylase
MPIGPHAPIPRKDKISVAFLVEKLRKKVQIELEACVNDGACENRFITEQELHRPGLAMAGFVELYTHQRIQILGNTECEYLRKFDIDGQKQAFANILEFDVPVIFLTHGNRIPQELMDMAAVFSIPIFRTPVETTKFMFQLRDFLDDQFALQTVVHGSMVDVYGIGILITGKSGIGKSEVALDLIERGHRLVADDVVMLTRKNNIVMAASTDMNKHYMEIRGLGIIEVLSMFGIRSIRYQKRLEVVVELFLWEEGRQINRTGLEKDTVSLLDVDIPIVHLPITPGKNITVIAEVIAMNHLLSNYGYDAAQAFQEKLKERIAQKGRGSSIPGRVVDYFEGDVE